MQFFDLARPCPDEITDCNKHRAEYIRELNELKMRGGCSPCIEKSLKNRYITFLQPLLKQQ